MWTRVTAFKFQTRHIIYHIHVHEYLYQPPKFLILGREDSTEVFFFKVLHLQIVFTLEIIILQFRSSFSKVVPHA